MPQVAAAIAPIALNLAIGVGASLLAGLFRPQIQTARVETKRGATFELEVGESAAVRAIMGLGRATGRLAYVNEFGTDNEYVQMVVDIGHGWHDGLEHFLVDEKPETLSGSNADPFGRSVDAFTVSGTPYLWVKTYNGAPGQTADAELIARANPAGRWTANHKFTGVAYMIITCRYNEDLFGSTIPRFGSVWRGLRLHDWRVPGAIWGDQSTYVFSKNPAVIRYNYRRGIYVNGVRVLGQGFPAFSCDMAGYTAAANRCDEAFYDPVSGKTFPIFEYGRQVSDDEEKLSVLRELDDAYCGSSFKRGGADVPLPAQQLVPVMTLADSDRLGGEPIRVDRKGVVSQKKTMWHGQFISHESGWADAPFTPRVNEELESLLGGRRSATMNQRYEHVQERAQLRAEIALRRQFYPATRQESFGPRALVLEPGDALTRNSAEWGPMLMVVEKVERVLVDGALIGARLTLTQWSNIIVPASGDSFVELPPAIGPGNASPNRTIAVSGLNVVAYQRSGGGAVHPHGRASWTQITDANVDEVMIRYWPASGSEAADSENVFASARLQDKKVFGPLQPLTEYTGYAIPIRSDGRTCVPTNPFTFTTGPQEVPADVPATLKEDLKFLSVGLRSLQARVEHFDTLLSEQDLVNFNDKESLKQEIAKSADGLQAGYIKFIEAAVGPGGAIAQMLEGLYAAMGGNTAEVLVRWAALATSEDVEARWGLQVSTGGGTFGSAAIMAQVRAGEGEIVLDAGRTVISSDGGQTIAALFEAGTTFLDNARIRELTAENVKANSLTANEINGATIAADAGFLGSLTVGTGNYQVLSVGTLHLADGAVTAAYQSLVTSETQFSSPNGPSSMDLATITVPASTYPTNVGVWLEIRGSATGLGTASYEIQLLQTQGGTRTLQAKMVSLTFGSSAAFTTEVFQFQGYARRPNLNCTYVLRLQKGTTNLLNVRVGYMVLSGTVPKK